jgi:hypothetical protein
MRICILGLLSTVALWGQKPSRSVWQDRCFNNPGAPYCQGRDFAVKPTKPENSKPGKVSSFPSTPQPVAPSGIDWSFADPAADAILGVNFSGLGASPLARGLIAQLGARAGRTEADIKKMFEGLSGIERIVVSLRDGQLVALLMGSVMGSTLPADEPGMKIASISGSAMLYGSADAVDQAVQRMAAKAPPSELAQWAEQRQASGDFWAIGSARVVGQEAVNAGVKRFSLAVSMRDRLTSDLAIEFNGDPSAKTAEQWSSLGASTLEGKELHVRMTAEAGEVRQKFGPIVASQAGEQLAAVVEVAQHLPRRDINVLKQTKPVIFGLEGGPKVVNQE